MPFSFKIDSKLKSIFLHFIIFSLQELGEEGLDHIFREPVPVHVHVVTRIPGH
jgi:hypothetical protein